MPYLTGFQHYKAVIRISGCISSFTCTLLRIKEGSINGVVVEALGTSTRIQISPLTCSLIS